MLWSFWDSALSQRLFTLNSRKQVTLPKRKCCSARCPFHLRTAVLFANSRPASYAASCNKVCLITLSKELAISFARPDDAAVGHVFLNTVCSYGHAAVVVVAVLLQPGLNSVLCQLHIAAQLGRCLRPDECASNGEEQTAWNAGIASQPHVSWKNRALYWSFDEAAMLIRLESRHSIHSRRNRKSFRKHFNGGMSCGKKLFFWRRQFQYSLTLELSS